MNATVGAWEPAGELGASHAEALDLALPSLQAQSVGDETARLLREVVHADADAQGQLFADRDSARLTDWLRVLTLAEAVVPGCEAGAKSPVIALARTLRDRGDYPPSLTAWIRSVSRNRFLPYGSLKQRLARAP